MEASEGRNLKVILLSQEHYDLYFSNWIIRAWSLNPFNGVSNINAHKIYMYAVFPLFRHSPFALCFF